MAGGLLFPHIAARIDHPVPDFESGNVSFSSHGDETVYFVVDGSDCSDNIELRSPQISLRYCEERGPIVCICEAKVRAGNHHVHMSSGKQLKVLAHLDGGGAREFFGGVIVVLGVAILVIALALRLRK